MGTHIKLLGNTGGKKPAGGTHAKAASQKPQPQQTATARKNAEQTAKNRAAQPRRPESAKAAPRAPAERQPGQQRPPKPPKRQSGSKKGLVVALVCVVCVIALLCGGTVIMAGKVEKLATIYPNVTIHAAAQTTNVEVGGMTIAEAAAALESAGYGVNEDAAVTVQFPLDNKLSIRAGDAGLAVDAVAVAKEAFAYGRGGTRLENLVSWVKCKFGSATVHADDSAAADEEYIRGEIKRVTKALTTEMTGSEYEIGETEISFTKGTDSVEFDEDAIYDMIISAFDSGNYGVLSYEPKITGSQEFDFDKLYDEVFKEPVSAEYDEATSSITDSVTGVSFDKAEAQRLWEEAKQGETFIIPLVLTEPEVTTESLSGSLFADCLAQKSTSLSGSSAARVNNITKAAAAMNGKVLNPGDTFSYNETLGQRTAAAGYQAAGAYSAGQVVNEIGGGICQGSSTLYFCALTANLEIVERHCHMFGVSYLPAGLDATVSWPGPDFKFKNDRDFPIKIEAYTDMTSYTLVVKIWGTDVDGSYVKLTYETWSMANGFGAQSYRNVYDKDGNLISSKKEATSSYQYHTEETDAPSPSPSPSADVTAPPVTDPVVTDPVVTDPVVTDPPPVVTDPPPVTDPVGEEGGGRSE